MGSIALGDLAKRIGEFPQQSELLARALEENPPVVIREGGGDRHRL